ncbi:hypothetical protein P8452_61310 [Trifolium repens]|nr:hypothetical protein P8452_61310 [Trifolium repens]
MFPFGRWLACYFSWWEGFLAGSFSTFGFEDSYGVLFYSLNMMDCGKRGIWDWEFYSNPSVALDPFAVSKSTIQLFVISADELTEAYSTVRFPEKSDLGQRLSTYSMQSPYELDMANSEENARSCMEPRYNSKIC